METRRDAIGAHLSLPGLSVARHCPADPRKKWLRGLGGAQPHVAQLRIRQRLIQPWSEHPRGDAGRTNDGAQAVAGNLACARPLPGRLIAHARRFSDGCNADGLDDIFHTGKIQLPIVECQLI